MGLRWGYWKAILNVVASVGSLFLCEYQSVQLGSEVHHDLTGVVVWLCI